MTRCRRGHAYLPEPEPQNTLHGPTKCCSCCEPEFADDKSERAGGSTNYIVVCQSWASIRALQTLRVFRRQHLGILIRGSPTAGVHPSSSSRRNPPHWTWGDQGSEPKYMFKNSLITILRQRLKGMKAAQGRQRHHAQGRLWVVLTKAPVFFRPDLVCHWPVPACVTSTFFLCACVISVVLGTQMR